MWQGSQLIERERSLQSEKRGARLDRDGRCADAGRLTHPASVAVELIGRPLGRWCKVEFVVVVARRATDEGFEAGTLPKLLSVHRSGDRRQAQTANLARYEITEHQAAGVGPGDLHINVCRREGERIRMQFQR